ncbi:hypothetical protein LQ327_08730 [Actinomycetospora endophytica]|uniref:Uncharacterized protein n=1 Tax=Actinomycetospora endophytica TaxID=2291215 RepID=A0ABS8P7S7_9PSEU|nr:hypothetical protein [Actinomycetospora endophytica]MCD2193466.1 hypothetical protein [Actinomycetospora endophytica]
MAITGAGIDGAPVGGDRSDGARGAADDRSGGAERACHDLLVALAGRLPDRPLWRLRDWLAAEATVALRTALPRTLLRHRVGVTESERALLREVVTGWHGPLRLVDAVLHAESAPEATVTFAEPGRSAWDAADLVLRALLPTVGDVGEVRRAWRSGPARATGDEVRVVLVSAAGDLPALTGAVQRALRAHGGAVPGVEVIGAGTVTTAYHRAALAASDVLWRAGAPASVSASAPERGPGLPGPRTGVVPSPPELVRHG